MPVAASAIYFLNLRGDVLINRLYRDDVGGNMVDAFRTHIMQTKELGTCPVKQIGGCSFFYMRISNVYIVIVVSSNANVACAFKFVVESVALFKSYFGGAFDEDAIRNNFVLIYELLDEMSVPSSSQDQPHDDNVNPLWSYVTKLKKVSGGGNYEIQCKICDTIFNGSYTRVKGHLCKRSGHGVRACTKVSNARAIEFTNMDSEYNLRIEKLKAKPVSLPPVSGAPQDSTTTNIDPKKRKTSTLTAAFNVQARETLDNEIARMFYSAGLPFHLARNPHFRKAFSYAANNSISGYQPPGYNKLRTTLLQNERNHVANLLQPLKNAWNQKGVTIVSDGWSEDPRYYSHEWLSEDPNRVPPHRDMELTTERLKCFKRFFNDAEERRIVNTEFANFSDGREGFDDTDSLTDRGKMDPKTWWLVHGAQAPLLQKVALKLLAQPCSSSCSERNWSTYSFIHSLKRNKMAPHRAEDLVYVHSNLRLLSRNSPQYHQEETKMWDVAGDEFGSLDDSGVLEVANLSLDEPDLEAVFFNDDRL